jgi:ectoine hydroxylase
VERALADFERNGYAVVEDALAPGELRRLTEAVDRVHTARGGGALHELGFLTLDHEFLEPLAHPAVLPLVRDLLGWNIYVYHCHLDVHPPLARAPEPVWRWHQDGGRQNVDLPPPRPRLSVKVAWYLTDVTCGDDGATWIIPGSHVHDRLARAADGSTPPGAVPLCVRAGSAVLIDRRLWHARGDNVSNRTRKALFYAYTYRWIRQRDDLPPLRIPLERLDPVRRQLIGAGRSALSYWFPGDDDAPLRARTA